MALLLTEAEVLELFPMERAIERVEESLRAWAEGEATNQPRQRIFIPGLSFHTMAAAWQSEGLVGMKVYTVSRSGFRFLVLLFDGTSGEWLALMEADQLGRIRTGAASGVATKFLARADASRVGVIGSGRQARTQLEAVVNVRKISEAKVYSRERARREEFAREMSGLLGVTVAPAESAEETVRFGDVVIAATNASQAVVRGEWLRPGAHVNAIGANMADRLRSYCSRSRDIATPGLPPASAIRHHNDHRTSSAYRSVPVPGRDTHHSHRACIDQRR